MYNQLMPEEGAQIPTRNRSSLSGPRFLASYKGTVILGLAMLSIPILYIAWNRFWSFERVEVEWGSLITLDGGGWGVVVDRQRIRKDTFLGHAGWETAYPVIHSKLYFLRWRSFTEPEAEAKVVSLGREGNELKARIDPSSDSVVISVRDLDDGKITLSNYARVKGGGFGRDRSATLSELMSFSRNGRFILGRDGEFVVVLATDGFAAVARGEQQPSLTSAFQRYDFSSNGVATVCNEGKHAIRSGRGMERGVATIVDLPTGKSRQVEFPGLPEERVEIEDCECVEGRLMFVLCRYSRKEDKNSYFIVDEGKIQIARLPVEFEMSNTPNRVYWKPEQNQFLMIEHNSSISLTESRPTIQVVDYSKGTTHLISPQFPEGLLR